MTRIVNGLTVDVEDYFQVEALASAVPRTAWETMERRVEASLWPGEVRPTSLTHRCRGLG
jgi:hypothetical protein